MAAMLAPFVPVAPARLVVMEPSAPAVEATVVIVADDLIWSSRLREAVARAGGRAVISRGGSGRQEDAALVIVDLTGRSYDGVEAISAAAQAGSTVIAVGQHEDVALRKRALAAGARRVYSYNKLFTDGPAVIASWLSSTAPAAE